jgi:hypothetical protein
MQNVKANISQTYLNDQNQKHGYKTWPKSPWNILITGDSKLNSIGTNIRQQLRGEGNNVKSFSGDVRYNIWSDVNWTLEPLHTLIVCSRCNQPGWFEDMPSNKIEEITDIDVIGTMKLVQWFRKGNNPT